MTGRKKKLGLCSKVRRGSNETEQQLIAAFINKILKSGSHIPCCSHAVPLPCRSFPFDLHSAAVFDSHIPWHDMCDSALCVNQTRPHCVNQMGKPLAERHGKGTAWYV
jgi:hypothetical protein